MDLRTGKFHNAGNLLLAYDARPGAGDQYPDTRDNTKMVPKGIVVDDAFDWQGVRPPDLGLEELVIYEVHVKGFTAHASSLPRMMLPTSSVFQSALGWAW